MRSKTIRLGFLASHNGSVFQSIVDACKHDSLNALPSVLISNNSNAGALVRAEKEGIPGFHISRKTHPSPEEHDQAILDALQSHNCDYVILAGYMIKIGLKTLSFYKGKILNIHPALLPRHGGQGMFGINVHKAVIDAGEKETGITIHIIDENYDTGPIVAQMALPVLPGETPESLQERVRQHELTFFAETIQKIAEGNIILCT